MKRFILTLTIAALLAPGLSFAQDSTRPEPQKTNKLRLFKAGGIGCAAGAGIALLTGKKDKALTVCAAGAIVGGIASYQAQLKEFRELEAEAKAAGLDAQVHTKTVETKDGQAEALDKLVIRYPAADMQPVSAKTGATLTSNRINFIDKDNRRRFCLCLSKKVSYSGSSNTHKHFYEIGTRQ